MCDWEAIFVDDGLVVAAASGDNVCGVVSSGYSNNETIGNGKVVVVSSNSEGVAIRDEKLTWDHGLVSKSVVIASVLL